MSAKTLKLLERAIVRSAMYQYRQLCKRYGGEESYLQSVKQATLTHGAKTLIRASAAYAHTQRKGTKRKRK